MPEKIICPVCDQEVEVLHTPTGDEYVPHYRFALDTIPCPVSSLHTANFLEPKPEPPSDLEG